MWLGAADRRSLLSVSCRFQKSQSSQENTRRSCQTLWRHYLVLRKKIYHPRESDNYPHPTHMDAGNLV